MRKTLLVLLLLVIWSKPKAQDAHLSMYDAAPLFLNSGMTGVFEGSWRLHGQYRTQWKSVNFKPYTSALLSFDMPLGKWGIGMQVNNFRAGFGNFNVLQGLVSAAYNLPLDRKKRNIISFGVQAGAMQKTVEYNLLSYNNQYTLNNGGEFATSISSQETFNPQRSVLPMVNASVLYYFAKQQSKLNPFIGFSAFNLTQPRESFFSQNNNLPMRFYLHTGTRINITEQLYLLPKLLFMQQLKYSEQTASVEAGYFMKGSETYLLGGLIYRNSSNNKIFTDAMIITVGAKKENIILKLGYDINISSLSTVSTGRGGFELSLTYMNIKNKPKNEKICPRL